MSAAAHTYDGYENIAAEQASTLHDLHRHQLRIKNREIAELKAELNHMRNRFDTELFGWKKQQSEATQVLRRSERELRQDLKLKNTELSEMQATLKSRDESLDAARKELLEAQENARIAHQRAYDAEVRFKDRERKLLRQCKQQAVDFQRRLTSAFEERLQKIKIKHAQDVFLARKSNGGSAVQKS